MGALLIIAALVAGAVVLGGGPVPSAPEGIAVVPDSKGKIGLLVSDARKAYAWAVSTGEEKLGFTDGTNLGVALDQLADLLSPNVKPSGFSLAGKGDDEWSDVIRVAMNKTWGEGKLLVSSFLDRQGM